jgi:Mg2+ and Co2+ transporter CorA
MQPMHQASPSDAPRPGPDLCAGRVGRAHGGRRAGGTARSGTGRVRLSRWADERVAEWEGEAALSALGSPAGGRSANATLWIDLADPDAALVSRVATVLGLHPLIAEDVVEGNQRAKVEVTNGIVHVVLFVLEAADQATSTGAVSGGRALQATEGSATRPVARPAGSSAPRSGGSSATQALEIRAREVDLILGEGFLLSAHPGSWEPRTGDHFRQGLGPILRTGPDHVLWAIVDAIVDGYFPFADQLEDFIDRLQDDVVDRPTRRTLEQLFDLKRDLIAVRRAVSPVREILNQLTNRELGLIDAEEILYFRDIYDHVIRLADELDTDRELVAATVEIYLSTINNNLSVIMKRLTGVTVILAGIGAIAGIFGMSEAGSAFAGAEAGGFWLVTLAVVAIAVGAALVLRRVDWI